MSDATLQELDALIKCKVGECPNHNCICYREDGCGYERILNKVTATIEKKFKILTNYEQT
jgi:hypothetical protein